MPRVAPLSLDEMDAHSRRLHHMFHIDEYTVTEGDVRNARHAYYGMLSYIDDKVGELMTAVSDAGLLEETLVVFASDHGEMLGERGLWYKQSLLEGSVRVPLIMRLPAGIPRAERRVSRPVSLLDLLPTFVDFASSGTAVDYVEPIAGQQPVACDVHRGGGPWRASVLRVFSRGHLRTLPHGEKGTSTSTSTAKPIRLCCSTWNPIRKS